MHEFVPNCAGKSAEISESCGLAASGGRPSPVALHCPRRYSSMHRMLPVEDINVNNIISKSKVSCFLFLRSRNIVITYFAHVVILVVEQNAECRKKIGPS